MSSTIDQLIAGAEVTLESATKRRDRAIAEGKVLLATAVEESRALTEDEKAEMATLDQRVQDAKRAMKDAEDNLEAVRALKDEEDAAEAGYKQSKPVERSERKPAYDQVARVTSEERTYHKGNDPKGSMFLRDVLRAQFGGDFQAHERLNQHMREERVEREQYLQTRAVATGDLSSGLVVPQFLTDMYAPATAALRPFANICNSHDLPADGMQLSLSRITTPTSAGIQDTEGTAVAEQDLDDTILNVSVLTNAGQQTLSRQVIDRGTGVEDIVFQDLLARYHTNLDNQLLNRSTNGLSDVATAVTYTSGTPTGEEAYPKIVEATSLVESNLLGLAQPSHAVMHPRRWYWLQSQLTDKFPLISQPGITLPASGANASAGYGNGVRGVLPNGLQVIVDANVSTSEGGGDEDEIYVVPAAECHLWEDASAPLFIRAEQPLATSLQVQMVVYGYFAFTFGRYPAAMRKVAGTGLDEPSF